MFNPRQTIRFRRQRLQRKLKCLNFNSSDHRFKDCKRLTNITRKVNSILQEIRKDAKSILFEICQQWEEKSDEEMQDNHSKHENKHTNDKDSRSSAEEQFSINRARIKMNLITRKRISEEG